MTPMEKEFIRLYNETTLPVRKIRVKLNLTQEEYYKMRNRLKSYLQLRKWSNRKKQPLKPVKNYSYNHTSGVFEIRKKGIHYCTCKKEKQAQRIVELLNENGWDVSKRLEVKEQAIKELEQ